MIVTIILPALSGRRATCSAAHLAGRLARGLEGVVVAHADDLVVHPGVEHGRHEAGADPLQRVRPLDAFGQHRRCLRLDRDAAELRLARLDHLAHAGDGAAGADAGHQDVGAAVGVVPDFLGRGAAVHVGIGGVVELLRNQVAAVAVGQFLGAADRAQHAFGAGREDQLGAVRAQQHAALAAHGVGHDQGAAVAARGAHHRQRDAGVAAGRFEDDGVGMDLAGRLGRFDHGQADAVFHAVGRVAVFQLDQHFGVQALGQSMQPYQRGAADQFSNVVGNFHGKTSARWGIASLLLPRANNVFPANSKSRRAD
jgi:hypothetical protein